MAESRAKTARKTAEAADTASKDEQFSLISNHTLKEMYTAMLGCRLLEQQARRRSPSRQLLSVPQPVKPILGQEAVIVGTTLDLRPGDTITAPSGEIVIRPQRRSTSADIPTKKAKVEAEAAAGSHDIIAFAQSSGAQLTIGAGVALANREGATERVVVAFGHARQESLSAWNEALNLAGKHRLPILFVLLPSPAERSPHGVMASIHEQARLAGVMTIPVDYTDAVAMYRVSFESIARARKKTGATLIVSTEFVVEGRRKVAEVSDPLTKMELYLINKGLFSAKWKAELVRQFKKSRLKK